MKHLITKLSVKQAMREVKSFEWEGDYKPSAQAAIKDLLEKRMVGYVDEYLSNIKDEEIEDRRNGSYERHLLTEIGDIVLEVSRTRRISAQNIVKAFARRSMSVDRMILSCFTLGLSSRKVSMALLSALGEKISPSTVSKVSKQLDNAVESYHKRPLRDKYRFLFFDGVVLKNKTGSGSVKKCVLVALGITFDGKKEVIDFKLSHSESQQSWESFLNDLYNRGLCGEKTKLIVVDGGTGLRAGLEMVYPHIKQQSCWAHKNRNVLKHVRKIDHDIVKTDLKKISHAGSIKEAKRMYKHFVTKWEKDYPKSVRCLQKDIENLLAFFSIPDANLWNEIRTTNAIERRFEEVRRRTRPMGVFADKTSMERILYAIFTYENFRQGTATPFLMTHKN